MSLPVATAVARLAFRLEVAGRHHLPDGPAVLAANHLSHVDPPFVGVAVGRPVRFMAAADLIGINRGLDTALPFYGVILLPRTGVAFGAMKAALADLSAGRVVGVFPEGRRAAHWGETEPKRGAAWLARRAGVPLVPVAVSGTEAVMSLESRRVRPAPVRVEFGEPLDASDPPDAVTQRWAGAVSAMLGVDTPWPNESAPT